LVTIVQSVTAVSVETKTATAIMTATLAPTTTNVNITPQNKSSSSSISHGAIAGIVIGVVLGTILLTSLILWFCGVNLFCIPGRNRGNDYDDDEKSIRDDSISIHNNSHLNNDPGLTGFGRTPAYLYNADELSIGFGTRRFSQGSLPDAAGGSESDSSNKRGLRVINPDVSDDEK
jgi:cell wall integrity and stress response component